MQVRVFNSASTGALLWQPPNSFAINSATGYQDVSPAQAQAMDNLGGATGFQAICFVGTTGQRPPGGVPQNPMGLTCYYDSTINDVIATDGAGNWRSLRSGAIV